MEKSKTEKIKRTPESSEEYQLERKKIKEANEKVPELVFGEMSLRGINVARTYIKDKEELQNIVSENLQYARKILLGLCGKQTQLFVNFIREIMTSFDLSKKIVKLLPTINSEDTFVDQAVVFFTNNFSTIPDDLFEEMLRFHLTEFKRKSTEFRKQLPELILRFKGKVKKAVLNGWLPANLELLEKRIHNETNFMLFDELIEIYIKMLGGYNITEGIVKIKSILSESEWEKIIDHELTHVAVSGRAIIKSKAKSSAFGPVTIHQNQKLGLGFDDYKRIDKKLIFTWLNEAVTESISMLLRGDDGTDFYKYEINILNGLIKEGMPQQLILDAYCETEVPEINGERVPAWKKFIAKLNEMKNGKAVEWLHKMDLECDEHNKEIENKDYEK